METRFTSHTPLSADELLIADEIATQKVDLVAMWRAIPAKERAELTRAFAAGFNEQMEA